MPRVRSVLVDNTIGRIFRNTPTVTQATAVNIIAGSKIETRSLSTSARTVLKVQNNIVPRGILFVGGGVVTQVIMFLSAAPRGGTATIQIRKGLTYANSVVVGEASITDIVPVSTNVTQTVNLSFNVDPGESVFCDVTSVGSISPGSGLRVTLGFYAG